MSGTVASLERSMDFLTMAALPIWTVNDMRCLRKVPAHLSSVSGQALVFHSLCLFYFVCHCRTWEGSSGNIRHGKAVEAREVPDQAEGVFPRRESKTVWSLSVIK